MSYQTYPPFQHAQPTYYQPAPAPSPADSFRRQYADRLRMLTFNSRPIIQDLSLMAMAARDRNDWAAMQAVVEEIEQAVLRAPPTQKLPLLYLLDSISKNVGAPYTTHLLPPIIPRLYVRTYREVDGVTKSKMEEMIGLWRNSGPDGRELYGAAAGESVERELLGSVGYQNSKTPNRQQVQVLVNASLENKRREVTLRPGDAVLGRQLNALMGIGELLNTSNVQPQELTMIMEQLQTMAAPAHPVPTPIPAPSSSTWNSTPSAGLPAPMNLPPFPPKLQGNGTAWAPATARPPFPLNPSNPHAIPTPPTAGSNTPKSNIQPSATPVPAPATLAPPTQALPVDVAKILQTLNRSGLGSQPRTPEVISGTPQPKSSLESYEDMILSMDIKLQSLDLNVPRELSFDHIPHRCQQCGMRFASANVAFDAHMDWHFRRNRKERESSGRGAHRKWLPRVEEWIINSLNTVASTDTLSPSRAEKAMISAERLAQLRQKWVKVPEDSKKAASVCPVCKEAFKAEWSDDEEEWVWKNSLSINAVYYHATCRAEQTSALKRLKAADPNKRASASASPGASPLGDGVKAEGPKRKVDDDHEEVAKRVKVEEVTA